MNSLAVLDALGATDATESALSDLAMAEDLTVTWLPDPLGRLDAIGHAAIPVDDGLLLIPYVAVSLGTGWEQLDLGTVTIVPMPALFAPLPPPAKVSRRRSPYASNPRWKIRRRNPPLIPRKGWHNCDRFPADSRM